MPKKRSANAQTERAGVNAVATACNNVGLIWRDLLQEDVGIDGTVELVVDGLPTGKLAGIQIKSGTSYIRSETPDSFKFYPSKDDLDYWRGVTLPVFLLVFDPTQGSLFWLDVQNRMENRLDDPMSEPFLLFSKTNRLDSNFVSYLRTLFDLEIYSDEQFLEVRAELEALAYEDKRLQGSAHVTALTLLERGLWGLCSKVQFHLSLLTEAIRLQLLGRTEPSRISYDLSRATLFPFLNGYFNVLGKHHLAVIDFEDLNYSLYSKLEWPTFVAPLTLNGRRFIEYLRAALAREREVRDRQFFNLRVLPHVQIEAYASFTEGPPARFGPYTDVINVKFNKYLDYYSVQHLKRTTQTDLARSVLSQTMFYYELIDYLDHVLGAVPKDNIISRAQDMVISPLTCWIERFLGIEAGMPLIDLAMKPLSHQIALGDELQNTMAPFSDALLATEAEVPDLSFFTLASGEPLYRA